MSTYDETTKHQHASASGPSSWVDRIAISVQDQLLLLARVLLGAIFIWSGSGKFINFGGFIGNLANQGVPMASVFGTIGACVEFFGGLAIVFGAWTRLAAILMVGFTAFATLIAQRYWVPSEVQRLAQQIQFMKNLAIIGGFLSLITVGAGRLSVDGFRGRNRR